MVEKIPFLAIALLITIVTVYIAAEGKIFSSMQDLPLYVRVLVSGNAIFEYCRLSIFPVGINPYIVFPKPLPYGYLVKTIAVAAITLLMLRNIQRRPAASAVWLVFLILLSPTLAFVQAGDDIAMAAHYTYLPAIAPSIAAAAVMMLFVGKIKATGHKFMVVILLNSVALCLVFAAGITIRLINVWKDTGTFWSRVIEVEPVGRAFGDRGVFYLINGRSADAVDDFSAAISIATNTGYKKVYNLYAFRGVALSDTGRYNEAIVDFDMAIRIFPHPTYFQLRGEVLKALGRTAKAEADFFRAGPNPPPIDWF
jgi:tetratricopeptide (TPR) repeat protein